MSLVITVVTVLSLAMLVAAGLICLLAALRPVTVPNRLVALDMLLVIVVLGVGVLVFATRSGDWLDLLVVVSLLGFVGTVTVARFVERRGA